MHVLGVDGVWVAEEVGRSIDLSINSVYLIVCMRCVCVCVRLYVVCACVCMLQRKLKLKLHILVCRNWSREFPLMLPCSH